MQCTYWCYVGPTVTAFLIFIDSSRIIFFDPQITLGLANIKRKTFLYLNRFMNIPIKQDTFCRNEVPCSPLGLGTGIKGISGHLIGLLWWLLHQIKKAFHGMKEWGKYGYIRLTRVSFSWLVFRNSLLLHETDYLLVSLWITVTWF